MTTDKQRLQQKRWYELNAGPKGTIGNVLPLAPGAINPMWETEKHLEEAAKIGAKALKATEPRKMAKREMVATPNGFFLKDPVELPESEEDLA